MTAGEVEATLRLKDEMSPGLKHAGEAMHEMGEHAGVMGTIMEEVFGSWPAKVAEGVLLRDMVHELIDKVKELSVEFAFVGSDVNTAHDALNHMAGGTKEATDVLEKMKEGVAGTMDELELMTRANKLFGTGAVQNADDLGTLTASARVLSREGYGPIPELLDKVSSAMQTGRTQRLALSGLTVDAAAAEKKYAAELGISREELSKQQKLHADRSAIIAAATDVIERAGVQELNLKERVQATRNAIKNWVDDLAAMVAASPHVTAAYDAIQQAIVRAFGGDSKTLAEEFIEWVNRAADMVKEYGPQVIDWLKGMWDGLKNIWHAIEDVWDKVPDWFKNVARDALIASVAVIVAKDGVKLLAESMGGLSDAGGQGVSTMANLAQIWSVAGKPLGEFVGQIKLLGVMIAEFGWAGFTLTIGSWGTALEAATIGPLAGLIRGLWAAAAGIEGVTGAIATGALLTGGLIIAFVALGSAIYGAYQWWKRWQEDSERAASQQKQDIIDKANLARINAVLGTSFTDLGEALKANNEYIKELNNSGTDAEKNLRKVGAIAGDITEGIKQMGRSFEEGESKVGKHAKAVKDWIESMTEGSKAAKVAIDGFAKLSDSQLQDADTLERLIPAIDKLANAHIPLTERMKDTYDSALKLRAGQIEADKETLHAAGVTQLWIEQQEKLGMSLQNIATKLGVSVESLKEYSKEATTTIQNIDDSRKVGESAAAAIGKSLLGMPMVLATLAQTGVVFKETAAYYDDATGQMVEASRGLESGMLLSSKTIAAQGALIDTTYTEANKAIAKAFDESKSNHLIPLNDEQKVLIKRMQEAGVSSEEMARVMGISLKRIKDQTETVGQSIKSGLADVMVNIPATIQSALTGGGGLSGAASAIGSQIGGTIGKGLGEGAAKMIGGTLGKAVGGAIPIIGSMVGPLIGMLFDSFGPSAAELEGRKIEKSFEDGFGGFKGMMDQIGAAYAATGRSSQQAQADVKALMDAEVRGGDAVKAAIDKINGAFNEQKQHIADVKAGLSTAVTGTNAFADSLISPLKQFQDELTKVQGQYDKNSVSLAKLLIKQPGKNDAAAALYGLSLADQIFDAMHVAADKEADGHVLADKIARGIKEVQPQFEHLGQYVAATFAAQIHEGASAFDAFTALAPSFQALQDGIEQFGLKSTKTIDQLMGIQGVVGANADVFKSVQSVTQVYDGLTQAGYITKDLFVAFGEDIATQFNNLVARGADGRTALMLMQPQLQKLWEGQQKFGDVTDESTKKMLDQAVQQGIVGEDMKGVNDKILDVLVAIADVFGAKLPKSLQVLQTQAAVTAKEVQKQLDSVHAPKIDDIVIRGRVDWEQDNGPDVTPMAAGGLGHVDKPTLFLAGEAGPEDFAFSGGNQNFGGDGGGGGGGNDMDLSALVSAIRDLPASMRSAVRDGMMRMPTGRR